MTTKFNFFDSTSEAKNALHRFLTACPMRSGYNDYVLRYIIQIQKADKVLGSRFYSILYGRYSIISFLEVDENNNSILSIDFHRCFEERSVIVSVKDYLTGETFRFNKYYY